MASNWETELSPSVPRLPTTRPGSCTRQDRAPSVQPGLAGASAQHHRSDRISGPARSLRKVSVASEKRPPVSPATTTSLARPLPPHELWISGSTIDFRAAPVWLTSARSGETRSTPTEPRGRQGIPQNLLDPALVHCANGGSRSRKNTLADTLAPASRQMRATADWPRTTGTVMANGVERTGTPASE